ncbi:hypothetical protein Agabi119p4_6131 [Agaricus bisporus var. burnettii]|uniref:Uncharacterized protein n=1 Tax=Agaricus bisporus var. burnettii TaxID=192524 RepID=A0A8H7F1A5_AGABI|nr:hypothetical protein Agabi119p4_6131 [Agaricus bisporus var. burnettii]
MNMHPDLKHAFDTNLSALEVIRLFTKHHSGVPEKRIGLRSQHELKPSDSSFWDTWQPLCHKLHRFSDPESPPASEAFMSIHKGLTRDVISWLCDSGRTSNVYLIEESQAHTENINENYRVNVFATVCYDAHRFGTPFRDTSGIIPPCFSLLSAALAAHYPPFRCILAKTLIDNPEVLNLPTRTQFKKLIYEPWKALQISHPQYVAAPPVIVLRGDDPSFWNEEHLRPIYDFASPRHGLSLLWIISFGRKCKLPIQDLLDPFECPRVTRLPVCYNDAPADTELFLRHRLSILRQKYKEMFVHDEVWPSEEQMSLLSRIFSGSFDAVDVVTQFVDYEGDGGPKAHLKTFLAYMVDSPSPSDEQPYCALDHFYTRAFSNIPSELLPVVKRVISVYETRSRRFNISESEIRFLTYEASLRIVCHYTNPSELLKPVGRFSPKAHGSEIKKVMENALWKFYYAPATGSHPEWTLLRRFDFRCLALFQGTYYWANFFSFVRRLYVWDKNNSPSLVRVEPVSALDSQFIDKCKGLAAPLDLQDKGESWEMRPTGPKYVLLGLEAGTVLVVLATTRGPGVKPRYCGFSIYTSAMLEYM